MNLIQKPEIFAKFHNGFPRKKPVTQIVLHGTGGGSSAQALFNWILGDKFEREQAYVGGEGFPYLIDRDGTVYQLADPAAVFQYHSGTGAHDIATIGIELINPDFGNIKGYTVNQYAALLELVFDELFNKFHDIKTIGGHGAIQNLATGRYKVCPGPNFRWDILTNELTSRGYKFTFGKEYIFDIIAG